MTLWHDLIYAVRSLAKARAFTFVCVVTLGMGMAPIIAIEYGSRMFTAAPPGVDSKHPTELVELIPTRAGGPSRGTSEWSYPEFIELGNAETGVSITGWAMGAAVVTLPDAGTKTRSPVMFVSSNYFSTIGVELVRGQGFANTDAIPGPVVIVGHTFWQRRLNADPEIVGKTVTLDGEPHTVAGIAAPDYSGHLANPATEAELFLPLERHPSLLADQKARFDRNQTFVNIHGRLRAGVSLAQANAAVAALAAQLGKEYPATRELKAGIVEPYYVAGSLANTEMKILLAVAHAITAIPLLIVCLNVAGMVQVRSAMRERELSIRQAIGASRRRLIQHLLAEAVVLAGLGGTLASIVLVNIPPLVAWWLGQPMPARMQAALHVDLRMLASCAGICLATSLVFGFLPALRFSRPAIMAVLKDEAGTTGLRAGRVHRVATALTIAMAVPSLVLGFVSLDRVRSAATGDLGFAGDQLYAAPLELTGPSGADLGFQVRKVRDSLARANGVAAVTVADGFPLDFRYRLTRVSTQTTPDKAPKVVSAHVTRVSDDYLETIGVALARGRGFTGDDTAGAPLVTVISKALADDLFPDIDPLGQPLIFGTPGDDKRPSRTLTIVGVTADFPTAALSTDRKQLLLPLAQYLDVRGDSVPVGDPDDPRDEAMLMLVARSLPGEPAARLTAALENTLRAANPDFDRASIVTGVTLRNRSVTDFLTGAGVGGIASGVSLLLAGLGIYGVVGLMVSTRTREIAVRITLGATRRRVLGMILFDVVKLVAPGVAVGFIITIALVRRQDFVSLSPAEPFAYVIGGAIAILAAVVAALAPARRAASVDPIVAMRST